jgi:outer membrane protein TolC
MRGVTIIIITLLMALPSFGLSLDEAVSEALGHNPEILAAQKIWEASKAKAAIVSTWPDPQVEFMYEQIPQTGGGLEDAQMKMYGISQMIPFPGKLTLKRRLAEDAARITEEKYKAKKREIIAKVKSAYYDLFLVEKSIQTNQENKSLLKKFTKITEAKYIVGKATQHDALKAQVELSLVTNELITLEQKRQTAQARLNTLLNRDTRKLIDVPIELKISEFSYDLAKLERLALENRQKLKAIEYRLKKTEKEHALARMEYLPDFKINILQREMRGSRLDGWNTTFMMNIPLWFWKQASGLNEAVAKREGAEAAYKNMENMVRFEVQDAFVKADSAKRLVELFKTTIVPQAEQALKSAVIAYESEKIDFLTLINSQKTLEDSKLKYFKALSDLGKSFAELERIVGVELVKEGG